MCIVYKICVLYKSLIYLCIFNVCVCALLNSFKSCIHYFVYWIIIFIINDRYFKTATRNCSFNIKVSKRSAKFSLKNYIYTSKVENDTTIKRHRTLIFNTFSQRLSFLVDFIGINQLHL